MDAVVTMGADAAQATVAAVACLAVADVAVSS